MSPAVLTIRLLLAACLGAGTTAIYYQYRAGQRSERVVPGVTLQGASVGGRSVKRLRRNVRARAAAFLEKEVLLRHPQGTFRTTWHDLGIGVELSHLWPRLRGVGRSGGVFQNLLARRRARQGGYSFASGLAMNSERALRLLLAYKEKVDRRAAKARIDLINRRIIPGRVGYELDVFRTLERAYEAARAGKRELRLAVREIRPRISSVQLKNLKLGVVLGWYETPYSTRGKWADRTYNLRVAARKLNGTVIMPDEMFDFNNTLGPRTQEEGYRIAPVIARGELVDGVAGGVCQISSTLFAAAFFAGLEVVKADVHSMPSHYIDVGLDATVVWPGINMLLRNPYSFPVVVHYEVNSGRVRAEILGAKRPYKIGFERRIIAEKPFKEEIRDEKDWPLGKRKIEQRGQRGYSVRRRRIFFDKQGHEVRSEYWTVAYPPTTMIIRLGSKKPTDPAAPPPPELDPVNPVPDPRAFRRLIQ